MLDELFQVRVATIQPLYAGRSGLDVETELSAQVQGVFGFSSVGWDAVYRDAALRHMHRFKHACDILNRRFQLRGGGIGQLMFS